MKFRQERNDYRELIELTLIFLNVKLPYSEHISPPGAMHHARWMSKALYSLKIWIFRNQFKLTKKEESGIKEFCIFVVSIYTKYWIEADKAHLAPYNDLLLLKTLKIEEQRGNAWNNPLKKFANHLWYLGPELIGFAFFDTRVSFETKEKMVEALNKNTNIYTKKASIIISDIPNLNLEDFVSVKTYNFFRGFGICTNFLKLHPREWQQNQKYKDAFEIIKSVKVVNDLAERGIALATEYNNTITKNEEERQYLLKVIADHRKMIKNTNKSNF